MLDLLHMLPKSRLWICLIFVGYNLGILLRLPDTTLKAWYATTGVDIITISFLSLVEISHTLKFLSTSLVDQFFPSLGGYRYDRIRLFLLAITVTLAIMAIQKSQQTLLYLVFIAVMLAFFSVSLDTMANAYRIGLLSLKERGIEVSCIVTGGLLLVVSNYIDSKWFYFLIAITLGSGVIAVLLALEPPLPAAALSKTLRTVMVECIKERYYREDILLCLL